MARQPIPQQSSRRISMVREPRPQPTMEEIESRDRDRLRRVLHSGPMRLVADAVIAAGEPVEIETETHIVTMTATPK